MLHTLLPAHELDHLTERLSRLFTAQQEATTALQQHGDVLDVGAREVVKADFEHVKDDVRGNHSKFCQI